MFKQVKSRRGSGRTGTNNDNVAIKHSAARVPQAAEGQKVMGSRTGVQFPLVTLSGLSQKFVNYTRHVIARSRR